jgi:predicted amino acid dehydrogenase
LFGLGGYTSSVTHHCTDLVDKDIAFTSGNSLTVAMGVRSLLQTAEERGVPVASATLGVVGAGGNIGSAYASIMADNVSRLVLFGGRVPGAEERCYRTAYRIYRELLEEMRFTDGEELGGLAAHISQTRAIQEILGRDDWDSDIGMKAFFRLREELGEDRFIRISMDLENLREIPLVVSATNAPRPFIGPEHLCPGAIVCDIAVPMNTRPEIGRERRDVLILQSGLVKLPYEEDIGVKAIPLRPGTVYACMAETMLLGLTGMKTNYSYGDIQKPQVRKIAEIAEAHGFTLAENPS